MVKEYLKAVDIKSRICMIKHINVAEQANNFECGYLTFVNSIHVLHKIKKIKWVPKVVSYRMKYCDLYREKMADMCEAIYMRCMVTRMIQFEIQIQKLYTEDICNAYFTDDKLKCYEFSNNDHFMNTMKQLLYEIMNKGYVIINIKQPLDLCSYSINCAILLLAYTSSTFSCSPVHLAAARHQRLLTCLRISICIVAREAPTQS